VRRPPPITEFIAYPITAGIGLLAVGVTALAYFGDRSIEGLMMSSRAFYGEPWRLVSSALPHGGLIHLAFNVYWLWVFGSLLEETLGHIRTLGLILLFAAGSAAAEYAIFEGGIGLSGVGYGLVGMLYVLSRKDRRFFDAVDASTVQLFAVWFFLCIGATIANVMRIANVAHGIGAVLGVLTGYAIAERGGKRTAAIAGLVGVVALSMVAATVLRPYVNFSGFRFAEGALEHRPFESVKRLDAP
jgi:membrane associated rhomboid family serine protease